ncbi:MAG: hypothetical protein H6619_06410 [Deltaproteobacteria bacterium]|nr:hypothetical protein [Deltaproteobacteria bacterium]
MATVLKLVSNNTQIRSGSEQSLRDKEHQVQKVKQLLARASEILSELGVEYSETQLIVDECAELIDGDYSDQIAYRALP